MSAAYWFLSVAVLAAALGAMIDLRTGHIPNWLTLGLIGLAPPAHACAVLLAGRTARAAVGSFALSLASAIACGAVPLALQRRGAIGGGDVKLFAAVGALSYPLVGVRAELYSFVFGAFYGLAITASSGRLASVRRNLAALVGAALQSSSEPKVEKEDLVPVRFGPAIFVGTLVSVCLAWRPQ